LYLGGEKLNRFRLAAFFFSACLCLNVIIVSAQTPDAPEPSASVPAERPSSRETDESLIIFGGAEAEAADGGTSFPAVLRMVVVLALTAAAIYGIVFWLKRVTRPPVPRNPHIRVLSSVPLGSNRYLHVVSVGAKTWLLGAGDGGVSLIADITDQEAEVTAMLQDSLNGTEAAALRLPDFKALLRRLGGLPADRRPGADNVRKRRERLKGL
jgi:flagellar protein FliO/FliZ